MQIKRREILMKNLEEFLLATPLVLVISWFNGFFDTLSPNEVQAIKVAIIGIIGQLIVIVFRTVWEFLAEKWFGIKHKKK